MEFSPSCHQPYTEGTYTTTASAFYLIAMPVMLEGDAMAAEELCVGVDRTLVVAGLRLQLQFKVKEFWE